MSGDKTPCETGVGLRNTEARLKYLYSSEAGLHRTVSDDHTAPASLTIPALQSRPAGVERRQSQVVAGWHFPPLPRGGRLR